MKYQWHLFIADLDPVVGSEQGRTRPVLVISDEQINHLLPVVLSMYFHSLLSRPGVGYFQMKY